MVTTTRRLSVHNNKQIMIVHKNKHAKLSRLSSILLLTGTIIVGTMLVREQSLPSKSLRSLVAPISYEERNKLGLAPLHIHDTIPLSEVNAQPNFAEDNDYPYRAEDRRSSYESAPSSQAAVQVDIVKEYDYIYKPREESWDSSPIVIESHKLIFFTIPKVGCTVWKQLFRRMMKYDDWASQDYEKVLPHNPHENGLKYLYNYSLTEASVMMTSPEWTRAVMVRDPKIRFLSAFIDKAVENDSQHIQRRCCKDHSCVSDAVTLPGFIGLCQWCKDDHWHPQNDRVDDKYWPYMDYILNLENAEEDAKKLLKSIGAWAAYGETGWGKDGQLSMFQNKGTDGAGEHARFAQWRVWQYYTPETEKLVEEFYREDYENPLFNFTSGTCLTCTGYNNN